LNAKNHGFTTALIEGKSYQVIF